MALYEREAYRVHNLALWIAGEDELVQRAVERTFLVCAAGRSEPEDVVREAVRMALAAAPARGPFAAAPDRLLHAIWQLPPTCRAALAIDALCEAGADGVGHVLGLGSEPAQALLARAHAELDRALGETPDAPLALLAQWPWAVPPPELWERVHAASHAALPVREPAQTVAETRAPARARRRRILVAVAAVGTLVAAAVALAVPRDSTPRREGSPPPSSISSAVAPAERFAAATPDPQPAAADGDAKPVHKPLTAEQLDRLRLEEVRSLERYARRQADTRLSDSERAEAGREVERILALARRRAAAAERREARLRRALARERERRRREAAARETARTAPAEDQSRGGGTVDATPLPDGDSEGDAESQPQDEPGDCLYEPESDTYICEGP